MKHLIFTLFIMCSLTSFSQDFNYSTSGSWVWLTPQEKILSFIKGKEQLQFFRFEEGYSQPIIEEIAKTYLTKEQLALLQEKKITLKTFIDYEGRIVTLTFMLPKELLKDIPEETLRKLYKAYCNVKFDMNRRSQGSDTPNEKNFIVLAYRLRP